MLYTYRYMEDRVSLPSTSTSSATSSTASDIDTGESTRTSTSYSDDQIKIELPGDFDELEFSYLSESEKQHKQQQQSSTFISRHPIPCLLIAINVAFWIGIHIAYPFPTTIPVFLGWVASLTVFTVLDYYRIFSSIIASRRRRREHFQSQQQQRPSITSTNSSRSSNDLPRSPPPYTAYPQSASVNVTRGRKIRLFVSTVVLLFLLHLGIVPPAEHVPVLHRTEPWRPEKYFIAANLYNNADVFDGWSKELLKLCDHLGHNSTFISIYESNSDDNTPALLHDFSQKLTHANIPHRFVSTSDHDRHWPYSTSQERIQYLANARNKAIEPLQSEDDDVRLSDWNEFTRVIFINDVIYKWEQVVRLIATRLDEDETKAGEYDLACGFDYSISGLYDTWVARDVCGTPFSIFWPYAKDGPSIERIKQEKPVEVAACWNGVVVFPAAPYLYKLPDESQLRVQKRSWKMIDNSTYPGSVSSPALGTPIKFRSTGVEACDHSECFLFSYDLHRVHNTRERPPRIIMNPSVKVAYQRHWYRWQNTVLRVPMIKWWNEIWSRGYPFKVVEFLWEYGGRRRDYCTWAGLNIPDRCPQLPGAWKMSWNEG